MKSQALKNPQTPPGQVTPVDADLLVQDRWLEYCDLLAAGRPQSTAARKAFGNLSTDVCRIAVGRFLRRASDDDKAALEEAQRLGAAVMAAETLDIADELRWASYAPNEANPVAIAKLRIDTRQWLASKYDRKRFGSDSLAKSEVNVSLNVSQLHAQALRVDLAPGQETAATAIPAPHPVQSLPSPTQSPPTPLYGASSPIPASGAASGAAPVLTAGDLL